MGDDTSSDRLDEAQEHAGIGGVPGAVETTGPAEGAGEGGGQRDPSTGDPQRPGTGITHGAGTTDHVGHAGAGATSSGATTGGWGSVGTAAAPSGPASGTDRDPTTSGVDSEQPHEEPARKLSPDEASEGR